MSDALDARDVLAAALRTVSGLRVYTDPGADIDPPAAVVGPPRLVWANLSTSPTQATFGVYLLAKQDETTIDRLYGARLDAVLAAIFDTGRADVQAVQPYAYPASGGVDLPAVEISVEMPLFPS